MYEHGLQQYSGTPGCLNNVLSGPMCGKYLPHPEQQHKVLTQGRRDHCFLVVYCNWPYQINITAEIVTQQFCLFVLCWQEGNPVWFSAGAANLLEATDYLEAVAAAGSAPAMLVVLDEVTPWTILQPLCQIFETILAYESKSFPTPSRSRKWPSTA